MAFVSDQQRKWFFANLGQSGGGEVALEFDASKLEGFDVSKYRDAFEQLEFDASKLEGFDVSKYRDAFEQ